MQTRPTSPDDTGTRPGPKAETLKIEGEPEEAIRRILNVRKPEGGFPPPPKNGRNAEGGGH